MKKETTISDAACRALELLGKASSIDVIYSTIVAERLYVFDTPTPEHVLRTTIRRHTENVQRIDSSVPVLFQMVEDEIYGLLAMTTKAKAATSVGIKRVHRAADKEELIRTLMGDQVGVFKEIWKLLLFAAHVGVANARRDRLSAIDSGKGIDQSTFGNCAAWPGVAYLLALAETKDPECLSGNQAAEDDRLAIFQEYANGGLALLGEFFKERPCDLDGLLAFIDTQTAKRVSPPDVGLTI